MRETKDVKESGTQQKSKEKNSGPALTHNPAAPYTLLCYRPGRMYAVTSAVQRLLVLCM